MSGLHPPVQQDERLLPLLLDLAQRQDHRAVVCLAERWPDEDLPRPAVLAEVRSLLALRQMDLALARLQELVDRDPSDIEAWVLVTHLYVQRGWTEKARRALDRVKALDPAMRGLEVLVGAVDKPPRILPSRPADIERTGSFGDRLDLAERLLATGSVARARVLLERLADEDPLAERVHLLLWGIRGDYSGGIQDFELFVSTLETEGVDRLEPTETLRRVVDEPTADMGVDPGSFLHGFPALFRSAEEPALDQLTQRRPDEDDTEVAQFYDEHGPDDEATAPASPTQGLDGDTEVLEIIGRGAPAMDVVPSAVKSDLDTMDWTDGLDRVVLDDATQPTVSPVPLPDAPTRPVQVKRSAASPRVPLVKDPNTDEVLRRHRAAQGAPVPSWAIALALAVLVVAFLLLS